MAIILRVRLLEIAQITFIGFVGVLYAAPVALADYALWLGALGCQIACAYYLNDFFDWSADTHNPRKPTPLPRPILYKLIVASAVLSFVLAAMLDTRQMIFIGISHIAGVLYSCPPFRWKEKTGAPLVGHFFMGFIYSYSSTMLGRSDAGLIDILWGLFWGIVLASASLNNEIIDAESDRRAGIRTLGNTWAQAQSAAALFSIQMMAIIMLAILHLSIGYQFTAVVAGAGAFALTCCRNIGTVNPLAYQQRYRLIFAIMIVVSIIERMMHLTGMPHAL